MRILVVGALLLAPMSAVAGAEAAGLTCYGEPVTITGSDGADVLVGTDGPDVIAALGGDDVIRGRGGDDRLCGGPGADRISGGLGADMVYGDAGPDVIWGGAGADLLATGLGNDSVFGGLGDDRVGNTAGADVISTGDGDDDVTLAGQQLPQAGPVTVTTGRGADAVYGVWPAGLVVSLGPGDDWFQGSTGTDQESVGDTLLRAGAGADDVMVSVSPGGAITLEGGRHQDHLFLPLARFDSVLALDQSAGTLSWGASRGGYSGWELVEIQGQPEITYVGSPAAEAVTVNFGTRLRAHMRGGDDVLAGADMNDVLVGGPGADSLMGGDGDDLLAGGSGADKWFDGGDGVDTASDPDDDQGAVACISIEIGFCAQP